MKMNRKMMAVAAVLAVGLAVAGCGASGSTASSASASASVSSAAVSESAAEHVVEPLSDVAVTDPMADGIYDVSFDAASFAKTEDGVTLQIAVYGYDKYDMVDVANLKVGDTLRIHNGDNGELNDMVIETLEEGDGGVTINGGIEEGGIDLWAGDTVYRTLTMDDYPLYYKVGEAVVPLAEDVVLSDSSADPQADAVVTTGAQAAADAVAEALAANEYDYWSCGNTTVRVENGKIVEITRRWVP